jgi:hypothetical protein
LKPFRDGGWNGRLCRVETQQFLGTGELAFLLRLRLMFRFGLLFGGKFGLSFHGFDVENFRRFF